MTEFGTFYLTRSIQALRTFSAYLVAAQTDVNALAVIHETCFVGVSLHSFKNKAGLFSDIGEVAEPFYVVIVLRVAMIQSLRPCDRIRLSSPYACCALPSIAHPVPHVACMLPLCNAPLSL